MSMNSPDYLTYKRNKMNKEGKKSSMSRVRVAFWVFMITFSLIFAIVVQVVRKYGAKIDIEYGRSQNLSVKQADGMILSNSFGTDFKRGIDNRLKLIQLEENAPNEAKILSSQKDKNEVIDLEHFQQIKKENKDDENEMISVKKIETESEKTPLGVKTQNGIISYSKVLIGKYASFEEARAAQDEVRALNQDTTPFIRKVGDVYALQVGSFQDIDMARSTAAKYHAAHFDVWIYQQ